MKIAWFTDTWLPTRDGVVTSLLSFKDEIEKRGNEIYLFVPGKSDKDDFDNRIFYYRAKPFRKYPNYRVARIRSLFGSRTKKLIGKMDIDIIHSHSPVLMGVHGVIASHYHSIPLVFTYHTFLGDSVYLLSSLPSIQHAARKLLRTWLKWYFRRCSGIIAPSRAARGEIKELTDGEIEIIPTGIDMERFAHGNGKKARDEIGVENGKIILHVGRIVKEKNLDLMVEAAPLLLEKIPDAIFVIVGEGPHADELKQKVRDASLENNFIFTGFVEDEKLPDYYHAADIFAFPSKYETQGIVAVEAMAAGLPVVAANVRSLPEIVENGKTGFLFDADDAHDFAEKMIVALDSGGMGEEARKAAGRYSIQKCTDMLLSFYEGFL